MHHEVAICTKCESCLMPFGKDPGKRESDRYCSLCFKDGELCYKGNDLKEFQKLVFNHIRAGGTNAALAWLMAWSIRFAPRWRR